MPYVTPETIAKAREIDLFSYLSACEPGELVRCGAGEYCTKEHDSLKISHGKWFWWSRGIGGASALDFLIKVRGMDFVSAVKTVCGQTAVMPSALHREKPECYPKLYMPPTTNRSCEIVRKYLISRGIDEKIIDECIGKGVIAEDAENGYALFIGYDEKGERVAIVGYSGSGKTTTAELMIGLYKPVTGRILLNRQDISTYHTDMLRQRVMVLNQHVALFKMSVRDNLTMQEGHYSDDELMALCDRLGIGSCIMLSTVLIR